MKEGNEKMEEMETVKKNHHQSHQAVLDMVYTAMFAAFICVCSTLLAVDIGKVPVTMQTFAVCLTAAMLGWKRGTMSVIVFILLGAVGLPVFANGSGGLEVLSGSTGGYIIGFVFTALIVGLTADKFDRKLIPLVLSMVVGILVCYAFGTPWFMFVTKMDFVTSLGYCVTPFLIFDAIKIVLATVIVNRLSKVVKL